MKRLNHTCNREEETGVGVHAVIESMKESKVIPPVLGGNSKLNCPIRDSRLPFVVWWTA